MTYCEYIKTSTDSAIDFHKEYHDTQYGFPITDDNELFGRLLLEINQAGLNWTTILKKQAHFRIAYDGFDIVTVANYTESDEKRLLSDPGVIRNKLKVKAAISNAQVILKLQGEYGSFKNWLDHHHPKANDEWTQLFRSTFKFAGGEIVKEFLLSTGYLEGAHEVGCPVHHEILKKNPAWILPRTLK